MPLGPDRYVTMISNSNKSLPLLEYREKTTEAFMTLSNGGDSTTNHGITTEVFMDSFMVKRNAIEKLYPLGNHLILVQKVFTGILMALHDKSQ